MNNIFPKVITNLPKADIAREGMEAYVSQADNHQIVFMKYEKEISVAEHHHESQWAIIIEGKIELNIDGVVYIYGKGDSFFIPEGVKHSAKVHAGYIAMTYFDQKSRFKVIQK